MIDLRTHLLENVLFRASPNHNERPQNQSIDLLVIHVISLPPNQFGGDAIDKFFTNRLDIAADPYFKKIADLRVAPHLFIRRAGDIIQYVPFHKRAWHAGESEFKGRKNCNDFSIGIELEGADDILYTSAQYQSLVRVTLTLLQHYPITQDRIVGHSDIAPGRKTDPGPAFDWNYYFNLLAKASL